jgi:hypothetical protein
MCEPEIASEQHLWLKKFVGDWTTESKCSMGPDKPDCLAKGKETVSMLGDLWMIVQAEGSDATGSPEAASSTPMKSFISVGYDTKANDGKGAFVGSFICNHMSRIWVYEGQRQGNTIQLKAMGPSFTDPTKIVPYIDEIELVDDNHKTLTSKYQKEDGTFEAFMWQHAYRVLPQK